MAQLVVRNIEDEAFARFKARARSEGTTAEALLRRYIEREPRPMSRAEALGRLDALRALSPASEQSSVELIRALRDDRNDRC